MLWILAFFFVMAPVFAVWENRKAERNAERLVQETRAEIAAGAPIREAPPERKKVLLPYALVAILISAWWSAASFSGGNPLGISIGMALLVWFPFHIFIFVKRTSTFGSLIVLALMIAGGVALCYGAQSIPSLASLIRPTH